MMKKITVTIILILVTGVSPAQSEGGSFRRNAATVIFCGLGGAVLGLSTLSFYGDPQEHVGNITAGFVLGLIGGSVYVTAGAMNQSAQQIWPTNPQQVVQRKNPILQMSWSF